MKEDVCEQERKLWKVNSFVGSLPDELARAVCQANAAYVELQKLLIAWRAENNVPLQRPVRQRPTFTPVQKEELVAGKQELEVLMAKITGNTGGDLGDSNIEEKEEERTAEEAEGDTKEKNGGKGKEREEEETEKDKKIRKLQKILELADELIASFEEDESSYLNVNLDIARALRYRLKKLLCYFNSDTLSDYSDTIGKIFRYLKNNIESVDVYRFGSSSVAVRKGGLPADTVAIQQAETNFLSKMKQVVSMIPTAYFQAKENLDALSRAAYERDHRVSIALNTQEEKTDFMTKHNIDPNTTNKLAVRGTENPTDMTTPHRLMLFKTKFGGYFARQLFGSNNDEAAHYCFERFGMSETVLEDGRVVYIGGEHEDFYDPDFFIYNDVVVVHPSNVVAIYGYPDDVFEPTDFHSATLVGNLIYIIGNTGYLTSREFGKTHVKVLNIDTYEISSVETCGKQPNWLSNHNAELVTNEEGDPVIVVSGGVDYFHELNLHSYALDVNTATWSILPALVHDSHDNNANRTGSGDNKDNNSDTSKN